jgi:hypothetical protein
LLFQGTNGLQAGGQGQAHWFQEAAVQLIGASCGLFFSESFLAEPYLQMKGMVGYGEKRSLHWKAFAV